MILLYILLILLFIALLYIFVLIKPHAKREFNKNLFCDYAHRGLHGNNVLENSLEAFKLACENKVGIELDVQLSKDGTAMVFHDFSLLRMTGVNKQLCELDRSELYELSLKNSEQKIPTLEEVLTLVNGQVPILVELKGELFNTSVCSKTAELLKEYKGEYAIESFNPFIVKAMKKYMPDALYGQLYSNMCRDKKSYSLINMLFTAMAFNVISRPDFIAYNKLDRDSFVVRLVKKIYNPPSFTWTTNGKEETDLAHSKNENAIFEIE